MVGRAVSPHPDPLPQGEGTAQIAQWKADGSGLFSAESKVHPLPKGEGWGEGKEPTALRGADVLALAYGRCAQSYMALSHSQFQPSSLPEDADCCGLSVISRELFGIDVQGLKFAPIRVIRGQVRHSAVGSRHSFAANMAVG